MKYFNINHNNIIDGPFLFNLFLHMVILFIILSLFYILYIQIITEISINNLLIDNIDAQFDSLRKNPDFMYKYNLYKNTTNNNNRNKNNIDTTQYTSSTTNNNSANVISNDIKEFSDINNNLDLLSNFSTSYYEKVFSDKNITKVMVNTEITSKVINIIILLVVILVIFTLVLVASSNLSFTQMAFVFLENLLTFILIGGYEFLFFSVIASKFVPASPLTFITILFNTFKKNFS